MSDAAATKIYEAFLKAVLEAHKLARASVQGAPLREADIALGKCWLAVVVVHTANGLGIAADKIAPQLARALIESTNAQATHAKYAAVEIATRKALSADFGTAGRLLREHLVSGAEVMKYLPIGIRRLAQVSAFGKTGAKEKKKLGQGNRNAVLAAAKSILSKRARKPSDRELATLIESKTGIPASTVRGHLTKLRKGKILD